MQPFSDTVTDLYGNVIVGTPLNPLTITVYVYGTTTLASLFQDPAGTIPQANPFNLTDPEGTFVIYAANGNYQVQTTYRGVTSLRPPFLLFDPSDSPLISGVTYVDSFFNPLTDSPSNWAPVFNRAVLAMDAAGGGAINTVPGKDYPNQWDGVSTYLINWSPNNRVDLVMGEGSRILGDPNVANSRLITVPASVGTIAVNDSLTFTNSGVTQTTGKVTNTKTFGTITVPTAVGTIAAGNNLTFTRSGVQYGTATIKSTSISGSNTIITFVGTNQYYNPLAGDVVKDTTTNWTNTLANNSTTSVTITYLILTQPVRGARSGDTVTDTTNSWSATLSANPASNAVDIIQATQAKYCEFINLSGDGGRAFIDGVPNSAHCFMRLASTYGCIVDVGLITNLHGDGILLSLASLPNGSYAPTPNYNIICNGFINGADRDCTAQQCGGTGNKWINVVAQNPNQKALSFEPETINVQGTVTGLSGTIAVGNAITDGTNTGTIASYNATTGILQYTPTNTSLGRIAAGTVTDTTTGATFTFSNLQDLGAIIDCGWFYCTGFPRALTDPIPDTLSTPLTIIPPSGAICQVRMEECTSYGTVTINNVQDLVLDNLTCDVLAGYAAQCVSIRNSGDGIVLRGGRLRHYGLTPANSTQDGIVRAVSDIANIPLQDVSILGTRMECYSTGRAGIVAQSIKKKFLIDDGTRIEMNGNGVGIALSNGGGGGDGNMDSVILGKVSIIKPLVNAVTFSINSGKTFNLKSTSLSSLFNQGANPIVFNVGSVAPLVDRPWTIFGTDFTAGTRELNLPTNFFVRTGGSHSTSNVPAATTSGAVLGDSAGTYFGFGTPLNNLIARAGSVCNTPTASYFNPTDGVSSAWVALGTGLTIAAQAFAAVVSQRWYSLEFAKASDSTTFTATENLRYSFPVYVDRSITIDNLNLEVTTAAGDASCQARLGLYADNGSGKPGALIVDGGICNLGNTTGVKLLASTISQPLTPGWYHFCCIVNRNGGTNALPALRGVSGSVVSNVLGKTSTGGLTEALGWAVADTIATWSSYTLPSTFGTPTNTGNPSPYQAFRIQ